LNISDVCHLRWLSLTTGIYDYTTQVMAISADLVSEQYDINLAPGDF
jgi:hypothetical protein